MQKVGEILTFGLGRPAKLPAAEIEKKLSELRIGTATTSPHLIAGDVFSLYPMNFKDELLVGVGSENRVKLGGAAIYNGMLIGRIKEVRDNVSVIQTVFDPSFSLPVRIGKAKVDALLKGGVDPKITLIPKSSALDPQDGVYSASSDLEFGLPIGNLGAVTLPPAAVFSEAGLTLAYSPLDLRYLYLEIVQK